MPGDSNNEITGGLNFGTVIQARDVGAITLRLPARLPEALSGLPPGSAAYSGRGDDMKRLLSGLESSSVAVSGMGGIGKTELAIQAARVAVDRGWFAGGALFVDMFGYDPERRLSPEQALDGLLSAVGVPRDHVPADEQGRSRLFRSVLAAYAREGRRILVVIDNVSSSDQARSLLPADSGAIITSREKLADLDVRLLSLGVLPSEDAVGLLGKALSLRDPADDRLETHPDDARLLAELCGRLPLALQIVSALLAENVAKPLAAWVAELADAATRLEELDHAGRSVRAAFDLSYRLLTGEHARLFRLLSLNPGPDVSVAAAAALVEEPENRVRKRLEALARTNLIEPGRGHGRWRMHDLVRLYASQYGTAEAEEDQRDQAWYNLLCHYLVTAHAANSHLDARVTDAAERGFPDRRRALEWLDTERANLTTAVYAAANTGYLKFACDLPAQIWDYLSWRRHLDDWLKLAGVVVVVSRTVKDRTGEVRGLINMGNAALEAAHYEEAVVALQEATRICGESGDRYREAVARTVMGTALGAMGRPEEAIAECRMAVEILQAVGTRHSRAAALNNLGLALRAAGLHDEAVGAHRRCLRIRRELGDRRDEASALSGLGVALRETGRLEEALTVFEESAAAYHDVSHEYGEALALHNVGLVLVKAGRFEEAVETLRRAVDLYRRLGSENRAARVLGDLEAASRSAGKDDRAPEGSCGGTL